MRKPLLHALLVSAITTTIAGCTTPPAAPTDAEHHAESEQPMNGGMMDMMGQMEELETQMGLIQATSELEEREMLLQEHLVSMEDMMSMMHRMGPMMGDQHSTMQHMGMMERMLEQMEQHQKMMREILQ